MERPVGTFIGAVDVLITWPKEVNEPFPILKNSTALEPVSATAKTPRVGSISMALGFNPTPDSLPEMIGGEVEKSGKRAILVTDGLLGFGGVVELLAI